MTKGRPFSIYCIILFLDAEARKDNHILLQRGMYLSQKWRQISLLAFQKPSDGYPIRSVTLSGVITIASPNLQKHKSERIYKKYAFETYKNTNPNASTKSMRSDFSVWCNVFIMLSSNIGSVNKKNSRLIPVRNQTGVSYAPENRQLTVDK